MQARVALCGTIAVVLARHASGVPRGLASLLTPDAIKRSHCVSLLISPRLNSLASTRLSLGTWIIQMRSCGYAACFFVFLFVAAAGFLLELVFHQLDVRL